MAPGTYPSYGDRYADILDHIRKKHPSERYTALNLQPLGLTPYPIYGTAYKGDLGVKTYSAKIHGVSGASRVSTLPRVRTGPAVNPPRAPTFSPAIPAPRYLSGLGNAGPVISRLPSRKRPTRTPSPTLTPAPRRPRIILGSPNVDESSGDSESEDEFPPLVTLFNKDSTIEPGSRDEPGRGPSLSSGSSSIVDSEFDPSARPDLDSDIVPDS
jgi:hypothetical protein